MATKPTAYINWVPDGDPTKIVTPPTSQSNSGWSEGEAPPAPYFNSLFYTLDQWVQWLDQNSAASSASVNANANLRLINGGLWSYVQSSTTLAWSQAFNIAALGVADSVNQIASGSVVIPSGSVAYVNANIPFSTVGDTTSGSNIINNIAYPIGIAVGQSISGSGIPNGTVVVSIVTNTITISANATATATGTTLTFVGNSALSAQVSAGTALIPGPNTVVFARSIGDRVYVGVGAGQMAVRDGEAKALLGQGFVSTASFTAAVALSSNQAVYVSQGGSDGVTQASDTTSGSSTVATTTTAGLQVGNAVTGTGIPAATTIASITDSTHVVLSANATATNTGTPLLFSRNVGQVYPCDSGITNGPYRSTYIGFTAAAVAQAATATVIGDGTLFGFSSLTPGALYYVDPTTPGAITATKPIAAGQYVIPVGVALSATSLGLNPARLADAAVVQSINVPGGTYAASSTSSLQACITSAQSSGGTIMLTQSFTLSASVTLPPYVVLIGQKSACTLTLNSGVSITLSDGAEIRDVALVVASGAGPAVAMPNNYSIARNTLVQLPTTGATGFNVTGTGNRLYNNQISGVMGLTATSIGIAYAAGSDNIGDSNIFTA